MACDKKGNKIRSKGIGRGLGVGNGKGPLNVLKDFKNEKTGVGHGTALKQAGTKLNIEGMIGMKEDKQKKTVKTVIKGII